MKTLVMDLQSMVGTIAKGKQLFGLNYVWSLISNNRSICTYKKINIQLNMNSDMCFTKHGDQKLQIF